MTDTNNAIKYPWPPANDCSRMRTLKFYRTSYNLQLSDPESEDTIKVIVCNAPRFATFYLPKGALQDNSDWFARHLKTEWTPSDRTIRLVDVDVALFDLFARWLASGTEVLTDEEDWKASYTEYLGWKHELAADKKILNMKRRMAAYRKLCGDDRAVDFSQDKTKLLCPVTVWDFDLTMKAWLLGDYLDSKNFQNHCMGHLYYMHLRFETFWNCAYENWSPSTLACMNIADILFVWETTACEVEESDDTEEVHPLRKFIVANLVQNWNSHTIWKWDVEMQQAVAGLIEWCPHLTFKLVHGLIMPKRWRRPIILELEAYHA